MQKQAHSQGKTEVAEIYRQRHELLVRCRRLGVGKVFADREFSTEDTDELLLKASKLTENFTTGYVGNEDLAKLDDAAALWREILSGSSLDALPGKKRTMILENASGVLLLRFQQRGERTDLDLSIQALEKGATSIESEDSPQYARLISNLASALRARYLAKFSPRDLDAAIERYQQALAFVTKDHDEYRQILSNLGSMLSTRYKKTGLLRDLELAIARLREAITHGEVDMRESERALTNLGNTLCLRYERIGSLSDLDEAIECLEKAQEVAGSSAANSEAAFSNNLASALHDRFERTANRQDLDRAIQLHQRAIDQSRPTSTDYFSKLNNYAVALKSRYRLDKSERDLEDALKCLRKALLSIPAAHADRPRILVNLQNVLILRHQGNDDPHLLAEAVRVGEIALASIPRESPWWATTCLSCSEAYRLWYDLEADFDLLQKARKLFQNAYSSEYSYSLTYSVTSARSWAVWELQRHNWRSAAEAGRRGVASIRRLLETHALRRHKETWLREAQGLAAVVAYAEAKLGECDRAIEHLEEGQACLLNEALGRDTGRLRELGHRRLCDQFQQRTQEIDFFIQSNLKGRSADVTIEDLRKKLAKTIERIRRIEGYEDFLVPMSFDSVRTLAGHSPIVYLLVTAVGGVALVVNKSVCTPVWLDSISVSSLATVLLGDESGKKRGYLRSYYEWKLNGHKSFDEWAEAIDGTTQWLYDTVMGPLLGALEEAKAVLVPCGLLALLPLHAAWTEGLSKTEARRYALDQCCFRFAASGRAILSARKKKSSVAAERLLAVREPDPDHPLPWAGFEIASVCAAFPSDESCCVSGHAASKAVLKRELERRNVFHFSGHARASPLSPLEGGLCLGEGEMFKVADFQELDTTSLNLAVLSACETALPGMKLPDEVVGLPTALTQARVARVVASLWSVADSSTAILISRFYQCWREDHLLPAEALRSAQQWLRDSSLDELAEWLSKQRRSIHYSGPLPDLPKSEVPFSHPFYWAAFTYTGID